MESCLYNEFDTKIIGIIIFIVSFFITKFFIKKYNSKTITKPMNKNETKYKKINKEDLLSEQDFFIK